MGAGGKRGKKGVGKSDKRDEQELTKKQKQAEVRKAAQEFGMTLTPGPKARAKKGEPKTPAAAINKLMSEIPGMIKTAVEKHGNKNDRWDDRERTPRRKGGWGKGDGKKGKKGKGTSGIPTCPRNMWPTRDGWNPNHRWGRCQACNAVHAHSCVPVDGEDADELDPW